MSTCLHHLLEHNARARPDAPAVQDGDRILTWSELDRDANRVAHQLAALGVRHGDRVGVWLAKSAAAVTGIYGVLKAGAAYVPLDPDAPVARVAGIATDAGIAVVVTGGDRGDRWADLAGSVPGLQALVSLTPPPGGVGSVGCTIVPDDAVARWPTTAPEVRVISRDLAYILYTSGSTGVPKGVMLTHDAGLAFVRWVVDAFGVDAGDRLSSHAPLHFDLSILDLYAAALAGACTVLVPRSASAFPATLAAFVRDQRITVWYSVPSVLTMLVLRGGLDAVALPDLRVVLFAGEVFPTPFLRQLVACVPGATFANLYGPTETNVCTAHRVREVDLVDDDPIPIGRPIDDVETLALRDDGTLAAAGEVGELHVRGRTVMAGYWGLPDRTACSLAPDPLGRSPDLAYRTGDLVRLDDEGNWRYLGRRDDQVKSRGYRIELGDVEAALHAHPSVVECAVLAEPDPEVTNRLHAVVVVDDTSGASSLVAFLRDRLPAYMVPTSFELRVSLPRTSTGKVDRRALARTDTPEVTA